MKLPFLLLLLLATIHLQAQPPALAWAKGVGSSQLEFAEAVATDGNGAVYYTGRFSGTVDFDPGPGTTNLTATGTSSGLFVTKFDSSGVLLWAKAVSSTTSVTPFDMTVDGSGNVIIGGGFTGTADFDPDPTATASHTSIVTQLFILKLTTTGTFSWVATMGGGLARVQGVAVDPAGNVYAAGDFQNTIDFDPGSGAANLTAVNFNDIFVCKFSAAGAYQWAGAMSGGSAEYGTSVAADGNGVYVGGYFGGTVDFDPGSGTSNLTSTSSEGFIAKLTPAGAFVWAGAFGGTGTDAVGSLAIAPNGDVYASGTFGGTADFDPGPGTVSLTALSFLNGFIVRLSPAGSLQWARAMAATTGNSGTGGIAVDATGAVYCTGSFSLTADLDPGPGTSSFVANGALDGYLCKLDAAGTLVWAGTWGGNNNDVGRDVALDVTGQLYVGGEFTGTADADLGVGVMPLTSAGQEDVFIAKYRASGTADIASTPAREVGFTVSPNPATDFVVLRADVAMKNATVRLIDAVGRSVREWQKVDGQTLSLNLDGVAPGVYVVEAATGSSVQRTQLVRE